MVDAAQNIRTKTQLRIKFELNGTAQPDVLTPAWNEAEGRYEADMTGVSFNPQGGTLHANISLIDDDDTGAVRVLVQ